MQTPPGYVPARLGLLLESRRQPAWVRRAVADLLQHNVATLELVVMAAGHRRASPESLADPWVLRVYKAVDQWLFGDECRPDALARKDVGSLIGSCPTLEIDPALHTWASQSVISSIERTNLDVLWVVGSRDIPEAIRSLPRRGVWVVDARPSTATAAVLSGSYTCEARLLRLGSASEGDRVLDRSWTSIDRFSIRQTLNRLAWRASPLIARALMSDSRGSTWPESDDRVSNDSTQPKAGNVRTGRQLARLTLAYGMDKVDSAFSREQWALAVHVHEPSETPRFDGPPTYHILAPPDRFWADPFPLEHEGRCYVFVEELRFDRPRGFISVLEINDRGPVGPAQTVLEEPHHLSYPSVFRAGSEIFMTPESSAARRIDLYRAVSFPDRWEKVGVLMDGVAAADPTVLFLDDRWWMFVNLGVPGGPNWDECHLFLADRLEGPWRPHPRNPIRSDVRRSRPAGRLFRSDGRLYRPAQDCSVRYGYATVVHEVERMTPTDYREREVSRIVPGWRRDSVATHTLNHAGRFTVLDCLLRRSRFNRVQSVAQIGTSGKSEAWQRS
jgi:hypothetical protein